MQSLIAQSFVTSHPQAAKVIPIFLAHDCSWNPWRLIPEFEAFTAARIHKQFAIFIETNEGKQALVPLALVVGNEAKRNTGTLKDMARASLWFDKDWEDIHSPVLESLPFLLICDGHQNTLRKKDAKLVACPFIYTGINVVNQTSPPTQSPSLDDSQRCSRSGLTRFPKHHSPDQNASSSVNVCIG